MNRKRALTVVISIIAYVTAQVGYAQSREIISTYENQFNDQMDQRAGAVNGTGGPDPAPAQNGTGTNIHEGAKSAQNTQALGAAANAAMGTALIARGSAYMSNPKTVPIGVVLIGMGLLGLKQAQNTGAASVGSGGVAAATDFDIGNFGVDDFNIDSSGSSTQKLNIDKTLAELKAKGFDYDEKTNTIATPNGTFSAASFGSGAEMEGLTDGQKKEIQNHLDSINRKIASKFKVLGMDINNNGGGGFGGVGKQLSSYGYSDPFSLLLKQSQTARKPASVAGLSVMAGGEPIGVKADDIFQMIHRRYQTKRKANIFVEN